ncbi:MAG TPA: alpha-hydroxy acid oxidase [Rhizomicrobium sp.]|nr:alpha-hydroxy acid oxidase [Rhizomicrobium sp.]
MTDTQSTAGWQRNEAAAVGRDSPAAAGARADTHIQAPAHLNKYLCLDDFEEGARRKLPRMLYGYAASGTETDASIRQNRDSFKDYALVTRVLTSAIHRDPKCTLFGETYAAPFGIAPMGASALFAYRGDVAMAEAAKAANIPMVLSGASFIAMEEVARAAPGTWFQAYLPGHPDQIRRLLERVAAAGFKTLVITVDVPVPGNREVDKQNGFNVPLKLTPKILWDGISHPAWLIGTAAQTVLRRGVPHLENYRAVRGPSVLARADIRGGGAVDRMGWPEIHLVRSLWKGTLVLKGILSAADAKRARECGADGVIISNHGGRQLDGAVAPLHVLPAIKDAVSGLPVMLDGGVRRGTDVIKALALGADFVFVGRPFLYAASIGGTDGVARAIALMAEELKRNMSLVGISRVSELNADFVVPTDAVLRRAWGERETAHRP